MSLSPYGQFEKEGFAHPREREQQAIYRSYSFGQFRLLRNETLIKESMWRRNKAKMLLKWFLLNPGKICSADQFVDLFWPDTPMETAFCNLYVTIHCLRRLLEPDLTPRQESKFIRRQSSNFYWFALDNTWWVDTIEVQQLFDTAKVFDAQKDHTKALFYYRKIVDYCNLGLLPEDDAQAWLDPYRRHYEYIYSQALMRLIQIYQQLNVLEEVLEYAYLALSLDPYCEPAIKAIIDGYLQQGKMDMAMFRLNTFQSFLRNELGVEPSKEIYALRDKIMTTGE